MGQVLAGGEQFETHIEADHRGRVLQSGPDSGAVDAFGRQRMSEPYTLFDSTMRYNNRPDQWFETISGSASSTFLPNESSNALAVTTASGDTVLRRTRQRFPYQPGKSLMVMMSFVGATPASDVTQEVGLFDDNNGVLVRASGTTVQFVIRSFSSGAVVENVVDQSNWNIDTLPSLDFDKAQIFVADLEWLGVGRVRCGFVIDGEITYCHEFQHANLISSVYMQTAILPLSYRIQNNSAQSSGRTLKQICCSILSEGGYQPDGAVYSISHDLAAVPNASGERITAGIRMASGRTGNVILPVRISTTTASSDVVLWRLRLNPTLSGVTWTAADNGRGNVEIISSGTTVAGGTIVDSGFVSQGSANNYAIAESIRLSLGQNASGVSDTLVLTVDSAANAKALGMIGWVELV
jgi:hypothetical protein